MKKHLISGIRKRFFQLDTLIEMCAKNAQRVEKDYSNTEKIFSTLQKASLELAKILE